MRCVRSSEGVARSGLVRLDAPAVPTGGRLLGRPDLGCDCPATTAPLNTQFWRASFDPTKEAVFTFLDSFIGEMAALFPDKILHLGGDEVGGGGGGGVTGGPVAGTCVFAGGPAAEPPAS